MKFLFASDSFKGTLSSERINHLLSKTAKEVFPECETKGVLIADGGEGTVDALVRSLGGEYRSAAVTDPLGSKITAQYGVMKEIAVIEMATASGLTLIPQNRRNPLFTTTFGTGELILDALKNGYRNIYVTIGGSGTNDGGIGAMSALGIRFLDSEGKLLKGIGADLSKIQRIDCSNLCEEVKESKFTIMCDVNNPLIGDRGATYIYGPQKGAGPEEVERLEAGMIHYASIIEKEAGRLVSSLPGAGAAGGLGAALIAFLNGEIKSGIHSVLDLIRYDEMLDDVDVVITGEGKTDFQTAYGKTITAIAERNKKREIPTVILSGGLDKGINSLYDMGVSSMLSTVCRVMNLDEACENAEELYLDSARRMFQLIKIGTKI